MGPGRAETPSPSVIYASTLSLIACPIIIIQSAEGMFRRCGGTARVMGRGGGEQTSSIDVHVPAKQHQQLIKTERQSHVTDSHQFQPLRARSRSAATSRVLDLDLTTSRRTLLRAIQSYPALPLHTPSQRLWDGLVATACRAARRLVLVSL